MNNNNLNSLRGQRSTPIVVLISCRVWSFLKSLVVHSYYFTLFVIIISSLLCTTFSFITEWPQPSSPWWQAATCFAVSQHHSSDKTKFRQTDGLQTIECNIYDFTSESFNSKTLHISSSNNENLHNPPCRGSPDSSGVQMEGSRHWGHALPSGRQTVAYSSVLLEQLTDTEAGRMNWRSHSVRGNPRLAANTAAAAWWEILNRKLHPFGEGKLRPFGEASCGCKPWLHTKGTAFWCSALPKNNGVIALQLNIALCMYVGPSRWTVVSCEKVYCQNI